MKDLELGKGRIVAAIFDMDGLLIDSEPFWRLAEQEVLRRVGVELTEDMCLETTGLRIDEVVDYWFKRIPWPSRDYHADRLDLSSAIVSRVEELVRQQGTAMPGVEHAFLAVRRAGLRAGLATSSARSLIAAVFEALDRSIGFCCDEFFEVVCTATEEKNGKPAPDVYLTAARQLGLSPGDCVAFEDSLAGAESARSAGMRVIVVPAPESYAHPGFARADLVLRSLEELAW